MKVVAGIAAAALVVALTGCATEPPATVGVVQAKHQDNTPVAVYWLCLGETRDTCQWHELGFSGPAYNAYTACEVGERYPDCWTAPVLPPPTLEAPVAPAPSSSSSGSSGAPLS